MGSTQQFEYLLCILLYIFSQHISTTKKNEVETKTYSYFFRLP
jgi:hypothetical protein